MQIGAGVLLWLFLLVTRAVPTRLFFWRAVGASLLMGLLTDMSTWFLKPHIGGWHSLVQMAAYVIVLKVAFHLSLSRAIVTALFFRVVLMAMVYYLVLRPSRLDLYGKPNQAASGNGAITLVAQSRGPWRAVPELCRWAPIWSAPIKYN